MTLEQIQESVRKNHDYLSYMCWQYERDQFAWKWRQDKW